MTAESLSRRSFVGLAGMGGAALLVFGRATAGNGAEMHFTVSHTPQQWQHLLGAQRYAVLREAATERPFSSPLLNEHRKGTFVCAGCGLPLFNSATKFESGTGWPSFFSPLSGAIGETVDTSFGMTRTEVHCNQCGGHLGHVFPDGPPPTGLRYCINGVALNFKPR